MRSKNTFLLVLVLVIASYFAGIFTAEQVKNKWHETRVNTAKLIYPDSTLATQPQSIVVFDTVVVNDTMRIVIKDTLKIEIKDSIKI